MEQSNLFFVMRDLPQQQGEKPWAEVAIQSF